MKLNTFNDVVNRYSEIKPLVSKHHTLEDDIRPIADRRRKHERIERVSSNKYILRDTLPMKKPNIRTNYRTRRHNPQSRYV